MCIYLSVLVKVRHSFLKQTTQLLPIADWALVCVTERSQESASSGVLSADTRAGGGHAVSMQ